MPETRFDEVFDHTGALLSRTARIVSDETLKEESAVLRLRNARATLSSWATDAATVAPQLKVIADQGGNVTQAQIKTSINALSVLLTRFGKLCENLDDIIIRTR